MTSENQDKTEGIRMPEPTENALSAFRAGSGHRRFQITAYAGGLKITGIAYYAADTRSTSRRASDYIHSLSGDRLTLSSARIFERSTDLVIDEPAFVVITMSRVDAIFADEMEGTESTPAPGGPA